MRITPIYKIVPSAHGLKPGGSLLLTVLLGCDAIFKPAVVIGGSAAIKPEIRRTGAYSVVLECYRIKRELVLIYNR